MMAGEAGTLVPAPFKSSSGRAGIANIQKAACLFADVSSERIIVAAEPKPCEDRSAE
ncbi:hypothetical protein SLG_18490 [Sphingobium sp. SYK-6]|nr:hypothetical protein SLG_18490 [Sphingobium sp. SYK-6]